jgi:hypothetical protein
MYFFWADRVWYNPNGKQLLFIRKIVTLYKDLYCNHFELQQSMNRMPYLVIRKTKLMLKILWILVVLLVKHLTRVLGRRLNGYLFFQ